MFPSRLKITLDLTIKNDAFSIPGGNIRWCSLELRPYGFSGRLSFWVASDKQPDKLFPRFVTQDLTQARVAVEGMPQPPATTATPLVVNGLVTRKSVVESTFPDMKGQPILLREYTIELEDPASLLWRQHFPLALYADATLADVIKQQVVEGITLDNQLDDTQQERSLICLSMGGSRASFYDFLVWYLDSVGGVLSFDYKAAKYCLSSEKPGQGKPVNFRPADVEQLEVRFPETRRHGARVLNSYSESASTAAINQDQAVSNVYQDALLRSPIPADVDGRKGRETTRLRNRLPEVEVRHSRCPDLAFWPGTLVAFQKELGSAQSFVRSKTFRVTEVSLSADAGIDAPDLERDAPSRKYQVELRSRWESQDDKVARLPAFEWPEYPIVAEGKVLCDAGKDGDRTYMTYEDKKTSQGYYKVLVPLWNQKVRAPFQPQFTVGHFYAPAFKNHRVLLALYFDRADILQFLEWGTDVQLANDTQGNQVLFGKNKTSQTQLTHLYTDNKPVFTLARTNAADNQLFQMEEGVIVLQTKEDQSATSASETYDLTPQVAAAREQLSGSTQSSIGQVTSSFSSTKATTSAKLDDAKGKTSAALDGMEAEVSGKVGAAKSEIQASMAQLDQKAGALKGQATAAVGELKSKTRL